MNNIAYFLLAILNENFIPDFNQMILDIKRLDENNIIRLK